MANKIYLIITAVLIMALSGPGVSFADKIHTVTIKKYQLRVDKNKPNEAEAFLLSEGGSGGVIVTPAEKPHWGNMVSLYATEMKELPVLGSGKVTSAPGGVRILMVFDVDVYNLPGDAWLMLNVYQSGATAMCPYSENSFRCGCGGEYNDGSCG